MNLLEAYKNKLAVADSFYGKTHNGAKMDQQKKLITAMCLNNISKFLGESFAPTAATQRTGMGDFKKFCLNLTTVAVPNLIAHDLVIVSPMSSYSGYVTYIEYQAGTTKGATKTGDLLNNPFKLGDVDQTYTSSRVVETFTATSNQTEFTVAWTPVLDTKDATGKYNAVKVLVDGVEATVATVDAATGKITLESGVTENKQVRIAYVYDNVVIPQNDLPTIRAEIKSIPLVAEARRIAVYYSQIAAYQASVDYGTNLPDQLAQKAVGQLAYEIDTEVTQMLIDNAKEDPELVWSKKVPNAVSKAEHYEGFAEMVEIGRQKIYDATKRFAPNYMLIASNVLPILTFIKGFTAAPAGQVNGPYFAGTLNGLKVFVTPNITPGKYVIGVNGEDLMSSAAVYAPYMAIVPTAALGTPDGANAQGFSTMYALKMLNPDLLVAGKVTNE